MKPSTTWSILIADDDPTNREILTDEINNVAPQATIEYAVNGEQAIEVAKTYIDSKGENFNIIFMDYQMPFLNGQEATHAIRKYEKSLGLDETQSAYIVTWSAARSTPYEGANSIISKPLHADELPTIFEEIS